MIKNSIDQLIEERGITTYQFWKDTGIGQQTAYDLVKKREYVPMTKVLDRICSAYGIQPGEILHWEEN